MASQKISEFNGSTSLNDDDLFTFVINGTNKNIRYSDLKTNLGVTGTLEQAGNILAAPVLAQSGTTYNIRNIESSKGVLASISAENGVLIGCNFTQSTTGTKLIPSLNDDQYKIKTLQSGEGISISDDGDVLTFTATGVATPSNLRFIAAEADFENQTESVITLEPNIFYQIGASFTTAKTFIAQDAVMEGLDQATTLTCTSAGSIFSCTNGRFKVSNIVLDCPNGTVFECIGDDSGNADHRINTENLKVLNCEKLLQSTGCGAQVFDTIQVSNLTGPVGVSIDNATPSVVMSFQKMSFFGLVSGAIGFDFNSSVSQEVEIGSVIMFGDSSATAISGLIDSGNISTGNLGVVSGCNFSSFTTQLSGIAVEDARWNFTGNAGLADSVSDALIHTESNALETTITTTGVPVKVNAVFLDDTVSRFSTDGTGRLTYTGEIPTRLPIDITATLLAASGGDKQVALSISLNGVAISKTHSVGTASSSKSESLISIWQQDFSTGDYIEAFVTNESDTINIVAQQCVIRVN